MGTLIHTASSDTDLRYGVNIRELNPPQVVRGLGSNVVGVVGHFPWGPVNEVTNITTLAELFNTFGPSVFTQTGWDSLLAFLNKAVPGGGYKVVRIEGTGAAKASHTFDDEQGTPVESVVVTAKYEGAAGNGITVQFDDNADPNFADMTVTIGDYSKTYKKVVEDTGATIVVTDPGDPYVDVTKHANGVDLPADGASSALSTGADGTPVALDWSGDASNVQGLRLFYGASIAVNVVYGAGVPDALADGWNTALDAYCTDNKKGMAVLTTKDGQTASAAETYVASYRNDRLIYTWPRVKTTNTLDPDQPVVEVGGESFAAVATAQVDPWLSPGGANGQPHLTGISGLEDESASSTTLKSLNAAGVVPWFNSTALGGYILHKAVTTDLTSGKERVFRRRMTDYIQDSLAAFLERFAETQLDLVLASEALGPNTAAVVGAVQEFLANLQVEFRIQARSVDPFGQNLQANIDDGIWKIKVQVKLYSMMEQIVLITEIGTTVTVSDAA